MITADSIPNPVSQNTLIGLRYQLGEDINQMFKKYQHVFFINMQETEQYFIVIGSISIARYKIRIWIVDSFQKITFRLVVPLKGPCAIHAWYEDDPSRLVVGNSDPDHPALIWKSIVNPNHRIRHAVLLYRAHATITTLLQESEFSFVHRSVFEELARRTRVLEQNAE